MNGKIMNAIMNGKVLRFKLMNGIRYWLDKPSLEWEKFEANPSYQKRKSKKTMEKDKRFARAPGGPCLFFVPISLS